MKGLVSALVSGFVAALAILLSACAHGPVIQDRPTIASVPVAVGCVGGDRPAPVAALNRRYAEAAWRALTLKQKAEAVSAQALRHQSRAEAIDAATSACRAAP